MKTFNPIRTLAILALLAAGCVDEEPAYNKQPGGETPSSEIGYLALAEMDLRVVYDTETETENDDTGNETQRPQSRAGEEPDTDGFIVEILDAAHAPVLRTTYGELKKRTEPLELPTGAYTLEVRSRESIPDLGEEPVYGKTISFAIVKNELTQLGKVTCTLANIKVSVMCSADLAARLDTEATRANVSLGTASHAFAIGDSTPVYFRAVEASNRLAFRLEGRFADGSDVRFSKTIDDVRAGQWRKISLVITYADQGGVKFDIKVENFVQDEEIVIGDTSDPWEYLFTEEPEIDPSAPSLAWTGHDLAQPVELVPSMFDRTDAFLIDLAAPNGLRSLTVAVSSDNAAFMQSMGGLQLPATFDLCTLAPGDAAYRWLAEVFEMPVGDALAGATAQRFDLLKPMKLLRDFEGTHTFAATMTDAAGLTAEAHLTLVVKAQPGTAAPSIDWAGHDLAEIHTLEQDMSITVDIAAEAGIRSLLVTIDSEALKPLLQVAAPSLTKQFDLCTIDSDDPDAADFLKSAVGFPVGEEVRGRTATQFSVASVFCNILRNDLEPTVAGEPNVYTFRLEAIDNEGRSSGIVELKLRQPEPTNE